MLNMLNILFSMLLVEADFMRSIGKIYVVTAVCLVVWIGIAFYLIRLEKKIKNLEDQNK